jgi:hypothetical protein
VVWSPIGELVNVVSTHYSALTVRAGGQLGYPDCVSASPDPADIAEMMDSFVHCLTDQPARGAPFVRQARRAAVPIVLVTARNFGAETPARRLEFGKRRGQIAIVVPKSLCPQVVEHRFQCGPVLGAGAKSRTV